MKFEWYHKFKEAFQNLKMLLTSAPLLKIVDPNEDFIVYIEAYKERLGVVLMQNRDVMSYESRKVKDRERNYTTYDLEFATIIHAFKMSRCYFM